MISAPELVHEYRNILDKQITAQLGKIADHRAPDYETYAVEYGLLNGLRKAREELDELVKKLNSGG